MLELAKELGLSEAQRSRTQAIFAAMKAEARRLGEALVAKKRELKISSRRGPPLLP